MAKRSRDELEEGSGRKPSQPAQREAPASNLPQEQDPVLRHYGRLHEGNQRTDSTTAQDLTLLQIRFRRRHDLANSQYFPEGSFLTHNLGRGVVPFLLITPPHLVPIRHADGTWTRVPRSVENHGAPPYSAAFYQEYLRQSELPSYFLGQEHVGTANGDEASQLELQGDGMGPIPTEERHLTLQEGQNLLWPSVTNRRYDDMRPFVIRGDLPGDYNDRLATRFPGLNAGHNSFVVVFWPNGRLLLRSTRGHDQPLPPDTQYVAPEMVRWSPASNVQASYMGQTHIRKRPPSTRPDKRPMGFVRRPITQRGSSAEDAINADLAGQTEQIMPWEPVDPTNGEPGSRYDQTGKPDKAEYYQGTLDPGKSTEKIVVVDRSTARLCKQEDHLLWTHSRVRWLRWPSKEKYGDKPMDFKDPAMIKDLNNWRRQVLARAQIFGRKRAEARESYTEPQRDWMMRVVNYHGGAALGPGPETEDREALRLRFNAEFGTNRSTTGVASLYYRIYLQWHNNDRARLPHRGRGQNKVREAQRNREAKEQRKRKRGRDYEVEEASVAKGSRSDEQAVRDNEKGDKKAAKGEVESRDEVAGSNEEVKVKAAEGDGEDKDDAASGNE